MNEGRKAVDRGALLDSFAAELTRAAYRVALQSGTQGNWLDLELGLWRVLAETVRRREASFPVAPNGRTNDNQGETDMGKLEGKIALVTGGSNGIGLATAKRFVSEGAYVFITGRREPDLAAAVKEVGRDITAVRGDVANLDDLDRLFAQIKREKGKLDVVFANAGVARSAPLGTITEGLYDALFDVNVKGLLFTVQKALPLLPDGASVILNASVVATRGSGRTASTAPPRPPCVPSRGPGRRTSGSAASASTRSARAPPTPPG
jgi:hypothetical protein